jgi:hypothetical protein
MTQDTCVEGGTRMRKAYQLFAGLLALEVLVQLTAIAYALAGLSKYIDDGGTVDKAFVESVMDGDASFSGSGGFALHGINGTMIIPIVTIIFLIVSLLANSKVPGAAKRAGIIFVMVALQVTLGISSHEVIWLAPLHALNGLGILAMAGMSVRKAAEAPAPAMA